VSYRKAGLSEDRYSFIPNGVDLYRYFPVSLNEKNSLRDKYGFAAHDKVIVFVGHFSPEKRPMLLYRAWVKLCDRNICVRLIFIGHTRNHFEVDEGLIESIRQDALHRGILPLIYFVEETLHIDEYMKVADVLVLPSIREGLPNVLLEAMACGLPCIVSDLPGVTDWLIDDGVTGVLFRSDDPDVLAGKISPYLAEHGIQQRMGVAARHFMESNFSSESTSQKVLDLYRITMGQTSRAT
jgi:glycosyltransferase involved in cell wall biosynthesis